MDYLNKTKEELIRELLDQKQELDLLKLLYNNGVADRIQIENSLNERLKELSCHDQLSVVMSNSELSVAEVCEQIVQIIPPAWQFPKIAEASIQIPNHAFSTPGYKPGKYAMVEYIKINQVIRGQIEVCYPDDQIPATDQLFLPEESRLLFSIAVKLGNYIEKKEKGLALEISEEKYKDLIENISDVIYTTDNQGNITFISPSITRLLGYNPEAIIGRNFSNFTGETTEHLKKRFEEIKDKSELQSEYQILSVTGEPYWMRFSSKALIKEGQFFGVTGTIIDITEKKQIELELQKSEETYRNLVESINDIVFEVTIDGTIKYLSPSIERLFQLNAESLIGQSFFVFVHPEDISFLLDIFRNNLFSDHKKIEYRCLTETGETVWVQASARNVYEEDRLVGRTGILRDITEQKLAEEKLRKSEEQYRKLVESVNDVIFDIDATGNIKFISQSVLNILGYTVEEAIGQNIFSFLYPEDVPVLMNAFKNLASRDYSYMEYRYVRKDGSIRWVRSSSNANIKDGEMIGATGTLTDVTERKKAEDALKQSEERLKYLISTQTNYVLWTDLEGKHIYWNQKFEEEYGWIYAEEGLYAAYSLKSICEYHHQRTIETVSMCIANPGEILKIELDKQTKDGGTRTTLWEFVCLTDSNGPSAIQCMGIDITERKHAEKLLIKSEQKFRIITAQTTDLIAIADENGFITFASNSSMSMFQIAPEEMCGRNFAEFVDENEVARAIEHFQLCMTNNGRIKDAEFLMRRSDGSGFVGELNGSMYTTETQNGILVTIRDITEKKKAEERLQKLSQAVEQSPVSIVITDLDGNIEYANPKASQTTGYTLEELKGKNPRVLKSGETPQNEYAFLWDSISKGNNWRGIFHNKRKNGELYWESSQITPINNADGKIINYLAIKEDITERKQIQKELAKSEERYKSIFQNNQSVMMIIDPETGDIKDLNASACNYYKLSYDEMCSKNISEINVLSKKEINAEMQKAKEGSRTQFFFKHRLGNGEIRDVEVYSCPLKFGDSTLLYSIVHDITDRRKAEEALKNSETELNYSQEIAHMGSWDLNLVTNKLIWSKNYYNLLEINPDEIDVTFDNFIKIMHPDDVHLIDEKLQEIHKSKTQTQVDLRLIMPDGRIKWVQNNIVPDFDGDILIALKGVNIDITEKKLAEESIRQQNERLSAIINAIPDLIFVSDREGTYLEHYNASNQDLLYPADQLIGSTVRDVLDEETANLHIRKINECLQTKNLVTFEYTSAKNGANQYFEARLAPLGNNKVLRFIRNFTQEKQKDHEIKKLSLAVEQSPVIIVITDLKGNIEYINQAFIDITGYSKEDVIGQNVRILQSGKTDKAIYLQLWETISSGKEWHGEWINKKKNGQLYWEEVQITPVRDDLGKVTNYLAVKQDITNRKQSEQEIRDLNTNLELKIKERTSQLAKINENLLTEIKERIRVEGALSESEKSYRTVVENLNEVIFQTDAEGLWLFLNKSWEDVTGFTVEESIGQRYTNFIHPDDLARNRELIEPLNNRKKDHYRYEIRYLTKDGGFRWIEVFARLALNELNEIIGTLGTLQDITDRRQAETALALEKQRLANIIEGTNTGTWEWNIQTGEMVINERWAKILGYTLEELSPVSIETWLKLCHPDDLKISIELTEKHFKGESDYYSFESRMRHKNGVWVWVLDRGQVHSWDQDGTPLTMSGTHQDITERKLAEDFENELLRLSPTLTGLSLNKISDAINQALSRIGHFLSADRAYIFEFNASGSTMNNSHEWCNAGINPEIENLQDIPCEVFPHWMEALHRHENIVIPSVPDLPESWHGLREVLEPQGIQSLIAIPLITDGILIGFVGLDSVVKKKEYTNPEINILKVWSSMLASLINNQRSGKLLEQTRQNYETFFNTIDDFLFIFEENGKIVDINKTVTDRLGYQTEEIMNQSVLFVRPVNRHAEALKVTKDILNNTIAYCTIPLLTKSGEQIPVETRIKRGFWNGRPVIFGVSKDISQIKISEQKFASAFHSNSAVMTITRFDNDQFVDVNNAFVSLLGYSREEIRGETLLTLGIVKDVGEGKKIQTFIDEGIPVKEIEIIAYSKSNELFIFLMSAEEIFVGLERCILSVAVNITERKIMENELRKAREEADQANLAKSEFLSRMSHELRTPMNSILGFAQLLEMDSLNARQSKGLNHIMKSGKHLLALINEVLDISRIEAGRLSLSLEPVQLSGVISEMIDIVKLQANEHQIKLMLTNSLSNLLFVKADRQRLKQIILNLLNNSVKYNRDNGAVTIQTELRPANSLGMTMVRISITDTGLGISEKDLPKLFRPFERIGAEKTGTEGTGLGLSVVKKLVEAMSGNLGVESMPEVGSTFWIEFPYSESQLENVKKSGGLDSDKSKLAKKSGSILYIEDNLSNIELVEQILINQRPELKLITNDNGKHAVQLASDYQPDLILLDLDLPDIHGREVLKRLQTEAKTREIPVIIISADAMPQQIEKLLKAGARTYLTKPLDVIDFLKVIDEFIVG